MSGIDWYALRALDLDIRPTREENEEWTQHEINLVNARIRTIDHAMDEIRDVYDDVILRVKAKRLASK